MTTKTESFEELVASFLAREMPHLTAWIKRLEESEEILLLADMPINKEWDLPDGTMDLTVGEQAILSKEEHHSAMKDSKFAYSLRSKGTVKMVMSYIQSLRLEEQQEAAMAFWSESRDGDYPSNHREWRAFEQASEKRLPEDLQHPFYQAVCDAILSRFKQVGWIQ